MWLWNKYCAILKAYYFAGQWITELTKEHLFVRLYFFFHSQRGSRPPGNAPLYQASLKLGFILIMNFCINLFLHNLQCGCDQL